jgi:hypothetical protein
MTQADGGSPSRIPNHPPAARQVIAPPPARPHPRAPSPTTRQPQDRPSHPHQRAHTLALRPQPPASHKTGHRASGDMPTFSRSIPRQPPPPSERRRTSASAPISQALDPDHPPLVSERTRAPEVRLRTPPSARGCSTWNTAARCTRMRPRPSVQRRGAQAVPDPRACSTLDSARRSAARLGSDDGVQAARSEQGTLARHADAPGVRSGARPLENEGPIVVGLGP